MRRARKTRRPGRHLITQPGAVTAAVGVVSIVRFSFVASSDLGVRDRIATKGLSLASFVDPHTCVPGQAEVKGSSMDHRELRAGRLVAVTISLGHGRTTRVVSVGTMSAP